MDFMEKKRFVGLDIVRVCAILFVILHHSITHLGLIDGNIYSTSWTASLFLRELTYSCVPLFIILSGYLQKDKKLSFSYYKSIFPLYLSYAIISILSLAAVAVYDKSFYVDPINAIFRILGFTANDYAWYFEMFLGLFLLIPFLNILYNGIESRKGKLTLILSLAFLTLLPDTVIGFSPYYDNTEATLALRIFPEFFESLYPVTYYFIGAFIADFKPRLNKHVKLPAVLLAALIPTVLVSGYSHARGAHAWYMMVGFQNICVCLTAIAVFLSLYDIEACPRPIAFVLRHISLCAFEMYLLSFIWDNFVYKVSVVPRPIMPLAVFALSFVSAFVLRLCLSPVNKLINKVFAGSSGTNS